MKVKSREYYFIKVLNCGGSYEFTYKTVDSWSCDS